MPLTENNDVFSKPLLLLIIYLTSCVCFVFVVELIGNLITKQKKTSYQERQKTH